jgi:non-homologous end joining protein Ku
LIEVESGRFEPEKIPDKYAETLRELLSAKVEQRAPQIEVATEGKAPQVINIMAALKESMQAKGRAKVRDAVRKRMGKPEKEEPRSSARSARSRPSPRRTAH